MGEGVGFWEGFGEKRRGDWGCGFRERVGFFYWMREIRAGSGGGGGCGGGH